MRGLPPYMARVTCCPSRVLPENAGAGDPLSAPPEEPQAEATRITATSKRATTGRLNDRNRLWSPVKPLSLNQRRPVLAPPRLPRAEADDTAAFDVCTRVVPSSATCAGL